MFKDSDKNQLLKNAKSSQNESRRPDDSIFYWLSKDSDKSVSYQKNPIMLSRDTLHNKYYDTFNFYFSKPINEILANVSLPHVVVYKDYLYFDEETEYLKRFYKKDEVRPKMENITNFYFTLTDGVTKTSFPLHDQFSIIQKRNEQRGKVLLSKLQSFAEVPPIQREANQNVNTEGPENKESRVSPFPATKTNERQDQSNNVPQVRKTQENLEQKAQKVEIKSKEVLQKEEVKVQEERREQNENLLQNQGPVFVSELSFDSSEHDIYSPLAVAEEHKVQDPAPTNIANNNNIRPESWNKKQDLKVGGAFAEVPLIQPDRDALRKMQKALFQAEREENELQRPEPVKVEAGSQKTFAENFLLSVKGDKNTLRGGVREREREREVVKENEAENKKDFTLGNSVSFSKKENFNSSRNNDSELKNTKASESNATKEPFKIPENLFKDPLLSPISPTPEANFFKTELQKIDETHNIHQEDNFLKSNVISMSHTHEISANLQLPGNVLLHGGFPNSHRPTEIPNEQAPVVFSKKVVINEPKISPEPLVSSETKVSNEEKSTASEVKPSYEIQAKPTETNISENSSERETKVTAEATPKTSAEYMKELMKKHYKVSEGSMSQPIAEKFKESIIFARLNSAKQQHKVHETEERYREYPPQPQKNTPNLWIGQRKEAPNLYNKKPANDQNVFHSIAYARGLYSPPSSGWNYNPQITPQKTFVPSPRSQRRLKSNEGVLLTQESSGTSQIMTTRRSPENTRSIGDFSSLETGQNGNLGSAKSFDQKKAEYKQQNKSKSIAGQKSLRNSQNFELDQLTGDFLSSSRGQSKGYASPYASNKSSMKLEFDTISSASRLDTLGLMSSRGDNDRRGNGAKSPVEKYIAQISKDYFISQKYNKTEESQGRTEESIFRQGYVSDRNMKDNSSNLSPRMVNSKAPGKFFPSQGGVFSAEGKNGSRVTPKTSRSGSLSMQKKQQQQQQIVKRNGKY